jgi:hypothetical protein
LTSLYKLSGEKIQLVLPMLLNSDAKLSPSTKIRLKPGSKCCKQAVTLLTV